MIEKTTFSQGSGNDMNIGVMFTKVDTKNRTVSGFATLDNIDDHGDRVSATGSVSAFKRFRGGLREMHLPNAVGTLVSFEETKKYDEKTDKVYDGIYVHAKVSKGAEDTWQKVLDGTLKGFSIGGKIKRKSKAYSDDGKEYGVIDDYDLIELSLVDNPANPLANVLTVQKIGDKYVYPDEETMEKQVMHIMLHEESGDVILTEDSERDGFKNIGWTDNVDNTEKIRACLDEYHASTGGSDEDDAAILLNKDADVTLDGETTQEGGATVATDTKIEKDAGEETVESTEEVDEVTKSADATDETVKDEDVEKAADVDESTDDDKSDAGEETDEVEKSVDTDETDPADVLIAKVTAAVADVLAKATDAAKESTDAAANVQTSFEKSLEDFNETISSLKSEIKKDIDGLAKRVEDVESDTAVKKSADVADDDAEEDDEDDSFWRGSGFLSARDLVKG